MVSLESRTLLGFIFIQLLHQYLLHFLDFFSIDGYVSIQDTFRILLDSIVTLVSWALSKTKGTLVSRTLLGFIFLDCCVSVSRTFRIHFHSIVTLVSSTPLGFFLIRLLRQYLGHFQKSFSFEGYVSISHTSRIHLS